MALTFPRDLTTMYLWRDAPFRLPEVQEISRTATTIQVRDLGERIWRCDYTTAPLLREVAEAYESDLMSLRGALRTFYGHTPRRPRPLKYSAGSLTGTVHSIRSDRQAIRITGLAASMPITSGDYVSISTGAGGKELFRFITGGNVSSEGLSPWLEVEPNIRVSVAVGDAATMDHPLAEMRLTEAPQPPRHDGGEWFTISFSAMQVIR